MSDEIQIEDFKISIIALWRKKLFIICVTILTTLIGLLLTFNERAVNIFIARTSLYSVSYSSTQEINTMATILASFSDIITSNKVCERAASILGGSADLDAEDIQRMIGVNAINGSVIEIYALSPRPELAISVANAIAEAFIKEVTSSTKNDSVQILDAAVDYSLYSNGSEDILLRRGIFALIGLAGSSIYIVYTELISKKLRTIVQCVEDNEEEILGIIPYINS